VEKLWLPHHNYTLLILRIEYVFDVRHESMSIISSFQIIIISRCLDISVGSNVYYKQSTQIVKENCDVNLWLNLLKYRYILKEKWEILT